MEKDFEIYFNAKDEKAKLIYTIGILWSKISSETDSVLSEFNLNTSKFNILMIIKHKGSENGIQQNEISKRLLVTPSNITKLLDRLEAEELITRNAKSGDKRVKLIKITPKADKLLDKAWIKYSDSVQKLTKNITEKDASTLSGKLLKYMVFQENPQIKK